MSGYTKGPWATGTADNDWFVDNDDENSAVQIIAPNRDDPVCIVVEGAAFGRDRTLDANARLIAAAPETLEAAKALLEHYLSLANSGDCGFWDPEEEEQVIAVRAAIAKAEAR